MAANFRLCNLVGCDEPTFSVSLCREWNSSHETGTYNLLESSLCAWARGPTIQVWLVQGPTWSSGAKVRCPSLQGQRSLQPVSLGWVLSDHLWVETPLSASGTAVCVSGSPRLLQAGTVSHQLCCWRRCPGSFAASGLRVVMYKSG